ncbi:uncharacterized protein LOC144112994 isoform X3 [Amblyomma americanum]
MANFLGRTQQVCGHANQTQCISWPRFFPSQPLHGICSSWHGPLLKSQCIHGSRGRNLQYRTGELSMTPLLRAHSLEDCMCSDLSALCIQSEWNQNGFHVIV